MAGAIALACVLASATPAAGEPRLTPQNLHPQQSAGVIPPPPVNPPPRVGTSAQTGRVLVWSWPTEGEPRRNQPNPGTSRIVPLTLKYGQQPPITSFVVPAELAAIRTTWEPPAPVPPTPLKLTAGAVVVASVVPRTVTPVGVVVDPSAPRAPLGIAAVLAIPGTQVPALLAQPVVVALWQAPPALVGIAPLITAPIAGAVASTRVPVPVVLEQPVVVGRSTVPIPTTAALAWAPVPPRVALSWSDALATQATTHVAALIPPPVVTAFVASAKASTPATALDVLIVRMPSIVAALPAPVVAFTRASIPVAIEWIAPSTLRVVTQGSTPSVPAPTPYTRVLVIGATHGPVEPRVVVGTRGIAALVPPPVVSAPDIALLGTFVQLVVPAMVSLATPSVTVALLVVSATVALATPDVAASLTSPDARIIPAPPQTSRPDL